MASTARGTLEASRFFVTKAEEALRDTSSLRHYLEAAVVFARSVTFHIQSEFSGRNGFEEWYTAWQDRLRSDPVAKFILERRNYVLKVGRVPLAHEVRLEMGEVSLSADFAIATVRPAEPWYRRHPRILWNDALRPLRELLTRRRLRQEQAEAKKLRAKHQAEAAGDSDYKVRFVDSPRADRTVTELLNDYLDTLEGLVIEAETRFAS